MISRRLFLRNTAAAGAVGTVAAPAVAAELEMTPHELVSYYADKLVEAMRLTDDTLVYHLEISHRYNFVLLAGRPSKEASV